MAPKTGLMSFIFFTLFTSALTEDFITCGGFVQSDIEINFSKIEVKLYTPQGALKYQTDCAPNNGYFMVPIYDKGSFILKLEPPKGWMFEPSSVTVDIDGETDKCSLGEDINFRFTGFTIKGKVMNQGKTEGPAGVNLLIEERVGNKKAVAEVSSKERGLFEVPNILPGDYTLTARHPTWRFQETSFPFTISKDVTTIERHIVVKGYDVNGRVEGDGEPIRDVIFALLSETVSQADVSECDRSSVAGLVVPRSMKLLCHVRSNQEGVFTFPSTPAGRYTLIPYYQGEHITFDVLPASVDVTVSFGSVQVVPIFKVEGFSVTGRVLSAAQGSGISGVVVSVQGRKDVRSKADGTYQLEKIKSGAYTLTATSEHVFFEPTTVKITPNTPRLPDIVATRFSLCGRVEVDTKGGIAIAKRRVLLTPAKKGNTEAKSTSTDAQGKFCFEVKPGEYTINPVVTDAERKKGLKVIPDSQSATITVTPRLDINFSQFKARVTGSVTCIAKCGRLEVRLSPTDPSAGDVKTVKIEQEKSKVSFQLQNVLPGSYRATVIQDHWCWEADTLDVTVTDSDVNGLSFKQTGYRMLCETTHPAELHYKLQKTSKEAGTMELTMGTSSVCLEKPGVYELTTESCHKFEKAKYTFDTERSSPVSLIAIKHRVKGQITALESATDIQVIVRSRDSDSETEVTPTLVSPVPEKKAKDSNKTKEDAKQTGPFIYEFSYFASDGDTLNFRPTSKQILFYPAQTDVTIKVGKACPGIITEFEGRPGKFISGLIDPPLKGVLMVLTHIPGEGEEARPPIDIHTDKDGRYRVGPLPDTAEFSVSASFEGYAMFQKSESKNDFRAMKLGEVTIKVTDDDGRPLSGVLLSLSGGSFRSNNLTESSGTLYFSKLEPHQYFLRTLMKEFEFTPKSQMIDVTEGASLQIEVKGHRVAFSCYGQITSLNGEPEPGVSMEAVGASDCGEFVEEGVSDHEGNFRIRGLQPNCDYTLQLKKTESNEHISRSMPPTQIIQVKEDVIENINVIVFRKMKQFDLSGNVVTDNEFLSTIKIKLFHEENPDSPVHTLSLGSCSFFQFPSLTKDDSRYYLRLDSSLSKATHSYILPEASFSTADGYHRHITLPFTPERKSVEQEIAQGSYLALPLVVAVVILVFNHNKVIPVVLQFAQKHLQQFLKSKGGRGTTAPPSAPAPQPPIDMSFFPPEDSMVKQGKKRSKVRKA